jgi:DnaA family protein
MNPGQLPLPVRLRDASVFSSYYAGRNRAVVDALRSIDALRSSANKATTCIFLHGGVSLGKTHLLQALCAGSDHGGPAAYIPLRSGVGMGEELLSGYGRYPLVCLDDAEAVAGHEGWEHALFRLHQELEEQGGRLVVSGRQPPALLGFRLRDLASRLNGGLVLTLQALTEEEQLAALQLRAQLRGFELPEETGWFLLRRLPRDMSSLCAFLDKLDVASLIAQRRLTVPFVRDVIERA